MSLLVVGSVAFDSVETPVDKIDKALGGSATYCSVASSYFSDDVKMIGVVGEDFGEQNIQMLKNHKIDISGLDIVEGAKTFSYGCVYKDDMNVRDTLFTDLNVFEKFDPIIPDEMREIPYVLLGNIMPSLQLKVLDQMTNLKFSVCDTMNLWIDITRDDLLKVIERVNLLVINDSEAKMLADEGNLIKAAKKVMAMGPEYLIIKKGTYLPHLKSLAEDSFKSVYIDKGAIPFLLNGADMMRPGIQKIEDGFKKGDIVIVRDENHNKALGVGFALFSSVDMQKQEKGKSLNIFHYFNDEHF